MSEPSQPIELLVSLRRDGAGTLGSQIEDQLRSAIRSGELGAGARLPSSRDLAGQLSVSRRIVTDAYAQLAAEGFLALRQGARPRVAEAGSGSAQPVASGPVPAPRIRFDFRPARPDVSAFPRAAWTRCLREAVRDISDADLGYGDPRGHEELRTVLADYLGRVRKVSADPERIVIVNGYLQGLGVVCHALRERGATRIALEEPSSWEEPEIAARAGLESVPVPVDELGLDVGALAEAGADAVVLTPAHQHPTGVVLAPERRRELIAWLAGEGAVALEDDYDAEYRYDRQAVGALQGLDPDHVVYAGTLSKTLAPGLRLGWLVVPPALVQRVTHHKVLTDQGSSRIDQLALARFIERGELDRHLRRMRLVYRARRDVMVAALEAELPEATVRGIAAGLHVTVELPPGDDEDRVKAAARERQIELATIGDYRPSLRTFPPTLLLGYSQQPEAAVRAGVRELAGVVRRVRGGSG